MLARPSGSRDGERAGGKAVILQVLPALVTGGVERGTIDVARAIHQAGGIPLVASEGGVMQQELERAGARHITLPMASKNPITMWRNIGRLAETIERYGVHLVHARSRAPAWSAFYAARRTGRHFVTTVHNVYGGRSALKQKYNAIMGRGDKVIAISEFVGRHAVEQYHAAATSVRVIPRGVNMAVFDPAAVSAERLIQLSEKWRVPEDRPTIMLPGRLSRWKGAEVLIDALAELGDRPFRGLIVGADPTRGVYKQELEGRIRSRGLGEKVAIVEHCDDMPAAYKLADCVVSASTRPEGFGRVAVEAQAMGRPVLATDHGGARETVLPGETGWLVPPGDAKAMAAALRSIIDLDSDAREDLAERARAHVLDEFNLERMCRSTIQVYNELIGRLVDQ